MTHINGPLGLCYEGRKWRDILDADGNLIASSVPVDYATEIVRSVNCHADLLDACEKQQAAILALIQEWDLWEMLGALDRTLYQDALDKGQVAIAKAKGEQ